MVKRSRQMQFVGWGGWCLLTFLTALLGGIASANAGDFYAQLVQPAWAPPAWLFGPVWSVLYLLMALSAILVWNAGSFVRYRIELGMFLVQLALNGLWSWLFFAWGLGGIAFAEIVLLWVAIVATVILFWRVRPLAGWLLAPYLIWVSFAAALNFTLWQNNAALL